MSLSKNKISEIFHNGMTDDSYKTEVRNKRKEYSEASEEQKQKLRKKNPDFVYLYDIIDKGE